MDSTPTASSTTQVHHRADTAYGTFYAAGIGGSVLALIFLVMDALYGRPLFTPTLLGSVAFLGAGAGEVSQVNLAAVAYFSLAHFAAFAVLGFIGTVVFQVTQRLRGAPTVTTGLVLFTLMEVGALLVFPELLPGVLPRLGGGVVFAANALTALTMATFLRAALTPGEEHPVAEREEDLVEGPVGPGGHVAL